VQSLCTLRNHCHQQLRNTRYRAGATLYLVRSPRRRAPSRQVRLKLATKAPAQVGAFLLRSAVSMASNKIDSHSIRFCTIFP
jgi:hypothetical protein